MPSTKQRKQNKRTLTRESKVANSDDDSDSGNDASSESEELHPNRPRFRGDVNKKWQNGEVVWAKYQDYPWWTGTVATYESDNETNASNGNNSSNSSNKSKGSKGSKASKSKKGTKTRIRVKSKGKGKNKEKAEPGTVRIRWFGDFGQEYAICKLKRVIPFDINKQDAILKEVQSEDETQFVQCCHEAHKVDSEMKEELGKTRNKKDSNDKSKNKSKNKNKDNKNEKEKKKIKIRVRTNTKTKTKTRTRTKSKSKTKSDESENENESENESDDDNENSSEVEVEEEDEEEEDFDVDDNEKSLKKRPSWKSKKNSETNAAPPDQVIKMKEARNKAKKSSKSSKNEMDDTDDDTENENENENDNRPSRRKTRVKDKNKNNNNNNSNNMKVGNKRKFNESTIENASDFNRGRNVRQKRSQNNNSNNSHNSNNSNNNNNNNNSSSSNRMNSSNSNNSNNTGNLRRSRRIELSNYQSINSFSILGDDEHGKHWENSLEMILVDHSSEDLTPFVALTLHGLMRNSKISYHNALKLCCDIFAFDMNALDAHMDFFYQDESKFKKRRRKAGGRK